MVEWAVFFAHPFLKPVWAQKDVLTLRKYDIPVKKSDLNFIFLTY